MSQIITRDTDVVSARAYALILSSKRLRSMLCPERPLGTPYEVLDYRVTLHLHDRRGARATFHRTQRVRFVQDGVSGILDHAWGQGVVITNYKNTAGELIERIRDGDRRHLVIDLKRRMRRGDQLKFAVTRTAMSGFTEDEEWAETTIDHPVKRLRSSIVFPKRRPCRRAVLHAGGEQIHLPVTVRGDGSSLVAIDIKRPRAHAPYTIWWSW